MCCLNDETGGAGNPAPFDKGGVFLTTLQKTGKKVYQFYVGMGIAAMAFVAAGVIFAVIMRYFFNISFTFLEELITLVFTFTTFWGIGICVLESEHVLIDFFFMKLPEHVQRRLNIVNYLIVLIVLVLLQYYAVKWIAVAGKTISNGLRIRYLYIYGIMPIGVGVSIICVLVKIYSLVKNIDLRFLKPVYEEEKEDF